MNRHHDRTQAWLLAATLATATLIPALLSGCSSGRQTAPHIAADTPHNVTLTKAQQQFIRIITVEPGQYHTTLTTPAVVDFDRNHATAVLAPFSGAVTKVLVTQGQTVKEGQALALVDSPDYASAAGAYRKALLSARAADAVASNDQAMFAQQAISARENAQAQAEAASADAERATAFEKLVALHVDKNTIAAIRAGTSVASAQAVIRAPIAGTVVAKSIVPGQTIAADATPCFTIADLSTMWVVAHLFGDDISKVRTGDTAMVDAGNGIMIPGRVTRLGSVVDPDTRSVNARISVANPHGALKKQMYVTARIRSHDNDKGLLIPVSALLRDDENLPFVYVQTPGDDFERHRLTLGPRVGDRLVVRKGLHAGDKVVVDGSIFLRFIENQ